MSATSGLSYEMRRVFAEAFGERVANYMPAIPKASFAYVGMIPARIALGVIELRHVSGILCVSRFL